MEALKEKAEQKAEALARKFGVDYAVEMMPLVTESGNGTPFYGLFNPKYGNFMASCTKQYQPVQNVEILKAAIGGLLQFGELDPEDGKIQELHEGRKLLFEVPIKDGNDQFVDGDGISQTIAIVDSKDTTRSFRVAIGYHVWSCSNGLYITRRDWKLKAKHTESIEQKIAGLQEMIPRIIKER